jgi:hypothetical protein
MPPYDDDDCCDHGIPLWEQCDRCEGDGEALFDADELGLDPEQDDNRGYPGGERA